MFCKLVGYTVLFRDGWLFPANVKNGKTQECMRLKCGHIPFDDHVAVLTFPEYRTAKLPIALDMELRPTCKPSPPPTPLLRIGQHIPDSRSPSIAFNSFFYKNLC